ncbi:MAG TPA: lipoprotein [Candidatus Binataceae bacterium]|nr:lipoprotein [Candidatus Binataceae bacterium]
MKSRLLVAAILIALVGCGVKGPPVAPELARPARIEDLRAVPDPEGIKLAWQRPTTYAGGGRMRDLGGFVILRSTGGGPMEPLVELPVTDQERFSVEHEFEYIDNETQLGQRYQYEVLARTLDGYVSAPSNEVALTRTKPPPPPNPETFTLPTPSPLPTS